MSFQLEPVAPEVFWTFQQELAHDGERHGMLHVSMPAAAWPWEH